MAKFNFNLRNPHSKTESPIKLVIRWDNKKLVYAAKEAINPKFWELDKTKRNFQRAKETKAFPEYPEFNTRLDWIISTARTAFRKWQNDNGNLSPHPEELKEMLDITLRKVPEKERITFLQFFERYIEESKTRFNSSTGKLLAHGTIKVYMNTLVNLKEFSEKKKRRIDFDTIDLNFYHDYLEFLSKEKNHSNNTVGRHIKTIKSVLNEATERGMNKNFAFKSKRFKKISEATDSIYLNEKELDELYKLDLSDHKRLDEIRDLFLVGCWTGLRFSDFTCILPKHIKGDFLDIKTKKTEEQIVIPINNVVKEIMKKYEGKTYNSLPPPASNPVTNRALKDIGKMLECFNVEVETTSSKGGVVKTIVKKKYDLIVTHAARRSFATNLYKDGLSSITIMKITGHRTERAFLKYIRVTPTENAKLLQQHWKKKKLVTT